MPTAPPDAAPAARPRWGARTVRASVLLLLGGIVAAAYVLLAQAFVSMLSRPENPVVAVAVLAAVTAVLGAVPPFLASVRTLEVMAVRTFLDVDVPVPSGTPTPATRWRAACWYGLHLVLGAAVVGGLLILVPIALELGFSALGVDLLGDDTTLPWDSLPPAGLVAVAAAMVLAVPLVTVASAAVLRQAAPALLGPDQAERIAELEAGGRRLAERGRLAQELHDSVGHALTVTTLQAAAAARSLDRDPEAARRALTAIEETGRSALADLDHVLGLLRADPRTPAPDTRRTPGTLDDVPALVAQVRAGGTDVTFDGLPPGRSAPPRAVSHEAYRVVQEALTNAVRHAPGAAVAVRATSDGGALVVEVANTLDGVAGEDRSRSRSAGGRGVTGMAARVEALGGRLGMGPEPDDAGGGRWVVRATFRVPEAP
ncbi:histidine kinase [Luteimicrobium album]|uniref:histidine kinase n=1 Tax=Luteimicrobium album TaxID=1054550 RepID=A0ABQ6HXC1_9MICO|nr:histidine kinase [Luteimicrobium album]GMA23037.1 histidine kinase [Luteimicrobium album]